MTSDVKEAVREYWEKNPNAAAIAGELSPGTRQFFEKVAAHRYHTEPCIREMAEFERWTGKHVVEIGCGMGTDLRQFAAFGALVVGIDLTWQGIRMAKTAFELFGLKGAFMVADAEMLPFRDQAFDLVYSNGVIHHTPDTPATVREIYRVMKTGGEARVMVYHRNSYFGRVMVGMILSPLLRFLLWLYPEGQLPGLIKKHLPVGVRDMYEILSERGFSKELLFSISTDASRPGRGNMNPLARSYSRTEARALFSDFRWVQTFIRQLYYADFMPSFLHRWAEHRFGWFLFIRAQK